MLSASYLTVLIFIFGYLAIIFEYYIKINKTASALLMAVFTWTVLFLFAGFSLEKNLLELNSYIGSVSQIIFFLLGTMTLVEVIDSHKGFKIITDIITTRSKKKMLWLIGL